jgi:hypothetical protein
MRYASGGVAALDVDATREEDERGVKVIMMADRAEPV